MVGAVIGNYQLLRKLGQGGMGVVYLGQHTLLGRRAAIKVLRTVLSARPEVVQRFFNEARAVTSVSDPGIVQVFDFGYHSDGSAFIIMEYLDGEPLDRRLERLGRLPVHEVLRLGRQLASSLAAAHAQQIIHRDLKPENILLVPDAEVAAGERTKILDFGIAKLSDDHPGKLETKTGVLIGTPRYMSPEQCRGLADIDHRSDIYALGCVLFHLVTGTPPFDGEGPGDIISAHIREPAPSPSSRMPELPPAVDALVMRCLAKSPADRFQSMVDVAAAIAQILLPGGPPASAPIQHLLPTTKVPIGVPAVPEPRPPEVVAANAPSPTTLGASSGQQSLATRKRRSAWMAVLGIAAASGIAIALVVPRSSMHPAATPSAPPVESGPAPKPIAEDPATAAPQQGGGSTPDPSTALEPGDASHAGDAPRASAAEAASEPGKRIESPADSRRRPAALGPASTKPRPAPATKIAPTRASTPESSANRTGRPTPPEPSAPAPSSAKRATHPTPPEPSVPPTARCTNAAFAAIYNAATPSRDDVHAALRNLNACRAAGALSDAEYEQTRDALVTRL